ncbi:MAG: TRAP transporter large permease subunit [Gammaproteobacteria bacterium]|nr:TRAP transporter large permease subunit [Gammaproteobacteria bacterium]NIR84962.1 TRAP transporter large permease subunit [Gammaproteobacteria bacterium]NIR91811.1 TRAP transporter large permease subunit [Gammaproteobacteria bacterium]NIU06009.1 TRAP transporter large permease subunit [Gammaproteobacteria bacterium]NIV53056.1 TRAP transporter large permease subunit [Gammaproteobacteria bacterium]
MGLDISIEWLTVLMFGSLILLLMAGLPLAFVTGGLACIFLFVFGDLSMLNILPSRIFPFMTNYQLSAVPLFIFMAAMLERAGLIEELFDVIYRILGGLRGGLATASIVAATILAAMVGVIGATEVTMGIIALPAMLKRGYNPAMACGSILAGGTLGILIPPSILAILFAVVAQQSVGELFVGAIFPGLVLSGLYILYVTARSYLDPEAGPPLPPEERVSLREKLRLLQGIITPILLVMLVLGVIFTGVATPVEAAGIGTFGALFVAAQHRRLNWLAIREAAITTIKASAMVLWIVFGASIFVGFYVVNGGQEFVTETIVGTGMGPYGVLVMTMILLVVLGMFLDWVGILLLAVPIFVPVMKSLTFGGVFGLPGVAPEEVPLWFGVVYMVNMQMAFLSPPFGYALFYIKSVAPPEITMATIFRAALPFLILQAIGLAICIIFPELILWLPRQIYG